MTVESATYIDDLVPANTGDATALSEGGQQIALIKTVLQNTFPNVGGQATATHTELNYLDITTLGTAQSSKAITVDASANCDCSAVTFTDLGTVTTADINGGSIDGTTIGASSQSTGAFTNLTALGNVILGTDSADTVDINGLLKSELVPDTDDTYDIGSATAQWKDLYIDGTAYVDVLDLNGKAISAILDEDDMASDSTVSLATQQSIKAYVDAVKSYYIISETITDVSTAETILIPVPISGTVSRVYTCLQAAINTADATVTLDQSDDSEIASITVAHSGSAGGAVFSDISLTNTTVTAGDYLKLATDGGSTGTAALNVQIAISAGTI